MAPPSDNASKPWAVHHSDEALLLSNVNIVHPGPAHVRHRQHVMIHRGKITAVREDPDDFDVLYDYHVVDLKGMYVCPGLIDCHVHFIAPPGESDLWSTWNMPHDVSLLRQTYYARQMLRRGFTTVRDCAGATLALRQAIDEGVFPGPRIFMAGKALSQTGGHGDLRSAHQRDSCACHSIKGVARVCDGVPACLQATRDEIRSGADFIKIMAGGGVSSPTDALDHLQFSPGEILAIVGAANNAGKMVTAHAYTPEAIRLCVENGCLGIEHGNLLDKETAVLLRQANVWLTPTLVTYHAMNETPGFLPPDMAEKNAVVLEQGLESLRIASEHSVKICYGTDLLGPLTHWQNQEFELRSRVLPAEAILHSATMAPAEMLGQPHIGRIIEGFLADLIILERNPLEDITILAEPEENICAVIKNGIVYESKIPELPAVRL